MLMLEIWTAFRIVGGNLSQARAGHKMQVKLVIVTKIVFGKLKIL